MLKLQKIFLGDCNMELSNQLTEIYGKINFSYHQLILRGYLKRKLSKDLKDEFWAFQGTDAFFAKVNKYIEEAKIEQLNKLNNKLEKIYNEYLISSPKSISIIESPRINDLQILEDELQQLINQSSSHIFAKKFPYVTTGEDLDSINLDYIPVKIDKFNINLQDKTYKVLRLWLCRKTIFKKRQDFEAKDLPDEMKEFLQRNDFKKNETQIRAESIDFKQNINYVDFLEDSDYLFAFQDIADITSKTDVDSLNQNLKDAIRIFLGSYSNGYLAHRKSLNNCLSKLYDEQNGRIIECTHIVENSGAHKTEKPDIANSQQDLRTESFHSDGMTKIQNRTNFVMLTKAWDKNGVISPYDEKITLQLKHYLGVVNNQKEIACYYFNFFNSQST